ncbi:MAG: hypothetical protein V4633_03155 [Pseudomonadota bacterium]
MTTSLRKKRVQAKQSNSSNLAKANLTEAEAILRGARKNPPSKNFVSVKIFGNGMVLRVGGTKSSKDSPGRGLKATAAGMRVSNPAYANIVGQMYRSDSLDSEHVATTVRKPASPKERDFYSKIAAQSKANAAKY